MTADLTVQLIAIGMAAVAAYCCHVLARDEALAPLLAGLRGWEAYANGWKAQALNWRGKAKATADDLRYCQVAHAWHVGIVSKTQAAAWLGVEPERMTRILRGVNRKAREDGYQ